MKRSTLEVLMDANTVPVTWRADAGDPAPREGFEDLYAVLDVAVDAVAALVTLAQAILPDDVSRFAFVALQDLARLRQVVNPGPTEEDPF
jgi:hypothetical protein